MAHWEITIRLGDLVGQWKNGDLNIAELAEKVVERLKGSRWRSFTADTDEFDTLMADLLLVGDVPAYTRVFDGVYDLADLDRVWIETT